MLMVGCLRPVRRASSFIEMPRALRSALMMRTTSAHVAARVSVSINVHGYPNFRFDWAYKLIYMYGTMFMRRLGRGSLAGSLPCSGGHNCPEIFEMSSGDFAIIGLDITSEATASLPGGSGCGPGERIVRVPRRTLVEARRDIPDTL